MKKHCVIVFLLLCSMLRVSAQTTYSVQSIPYSLSPVGSTQSYVGVDNSYPATTLLPFTFVYFGVSYPEIVVGSNGVICFDILRAGAPNPGTIGVGIPNSLELRNSIAAPYHDMDLSVGGAITYGTWGVAPYRRFVITWDNVPMASCNQLVTNSQVVLYETTNVIEINIANKPLCSTWNGGVAIVGIESALGVGYAAPNRNYPKQWTASQESWRFCPSSNCSVAPTYAIKGRSYRDTNQNCQQDSSEAGISNLVIGVDSLLYATSTDANGDYTLMVDSGTYVISQNNTVFYTVDSCNGSTTDTITIGGAIDTVTHIDFANTYLPPCSNKYVDMVINVLPRCSQTFVSLIYGNNGASADSNIVVNFHLPDSISLVSSSHGLMDLGNGNYSHTLNGLLLPNALVIMGLTLDIGCDTIGTTYCMEASISGAGADCDSLNNVITKCHRLGAALPPNSVAAIPNSSLAISVYPNPFSTSTLFHIGTYQNSLQFTLIDAMGRIVKTADINSANYTLNSDGLAKGIYFWRIIDQNGMPTTGRVVVQE